MAPKRKFEQGGSSSGSEKKQKETANTEEVGNPKLIRRGEELLPVDDNTTPIERFTWDEFGVFGSLKRQLPYLCWAFVLIEWVETLYYQKYNKRVELSLQELVDNAKPESDEFCYAFCLITAARWIEQNGISLAKDYPFSGQKQAPQPRKKDAEIIKIEGLRALRPLERPLLSKIKSSPTPAVLIYDWNEYYKMAYYYPTGVYKLKRTNYQPHDINHVVLLKGWGTTENGENYYESRDTNEVGAHNCGNYNVARPSSLKDDELEVIEYFLIARIS